ncbi:hypothetical protein GCM10009617_25310 [Leifsonia poae]|uniref:Choice-of-anchor A domain-containing protein n=1 Tax=Leifsonia poae TaxID=110933 RepID=A0A9W6M127_9MICO|nr:hypothetical protein GCM10017584_28530 [Leifsonia poae]
MIAIGIGVASLIGIGMASGAAVAAPGDVGPVNPVTFPINGHQANSGFTIFSEGNVALNADEAEGTVAVGGDLTFESGYNIGAGATPPATFVAPGDTAPTFLYVRGGVGFSSSPTTPVLKVLGGGLSKIADTSTYTAYDHDNNNALVNYQIVPTGAPYNTAPRIEGTVTQTPASIAAPVGTNLVDIDAAFPAYRQLSTDLGGCARTVQLTDTQGDPLQSPIAPGTSGRLTMTPGQTSVLSISAADLAAISEITFVAPLPDPTTPLVVNVVGTSFSGSIPNQAGIGSGQAPFMLWNFPQATTVTVTGGDSIEGTIYAPRAFVNWQVTQNIEGNVIAASFTHGIPGVRGGPPREVHNFPFSAEVSCTKGNVTPTPTPTPTPTVTPTITPVPTPSFDPNGGTSPAAPGAAGTLADSGSDTATALGVAAAAAGAMVLGGALVLLRRTRRTRHQR